MSRAADSPWLDPISSGFQFSVFSSQTLGKVKPQHHRFTKWTKDQSRTKKCNCCVARTCEVIFEKKVQVPGSLCIFVCGYNWHSECPTNVAHTPRGTLRNSHAEQAATTNHKLTQLWEQENGGGGGVWRVWHWLTCNVEAGRNSHTQTTHAGQQFVAVKFNTNNLISIKTHTTPTRRQKNCSYDTCSVDLPLVVVVFVFVRLSVCVCVWQSNMHKCNLI